MSTATTNRPAGWFPVHRADLAAIREQLDPPERALTATAVFLALSDACNLRGTDRLTLAIGSVASMAGVSYATADRRLKDLAGVGLVQIAPAPTGLRSACTYILHRHEDETIPHKAETFPHRNDLGLRNIHKTSRLEDKDISSQKTETHCPADSADGTTGQASAGGQQRQDVLQAWNTLARKHGLPAIRDLPDARWRKYCIRVREGMDLAAIEPRIAESEFLRSGKWFGFDWLVENATNWRKVLEGNYAESTRPASDAGLAIGQKHRQNDGGPNWDRGNAAALDAVGTVVGAQP